MSKEHLTWAEVVREVGFTQENSEGVYTYSTDFFPCSVCGLPERRFYWRRLDENNVISPYPFTCGICNLLNTSWKDTLLSALGHDGCY